MIVDPDETWRARAACRGVETRVFYVERGESSAPAKAICARCPVRIECLACAIRHGDVYGIWGGMADRERRPIVQAVRQRLSAGRRPLKTLAS